MDNLNSNINHQVNPVVSLHFCHDSIGVVKMQDEESKNTFSPRIIDGLKHIFEKIALHSDCKVVLVEGLDNYFCCGGTKEELMAIFQKEITFADLDFFKVFLECPVPVIAVMKGHALGGGLALACYADILLMAEESIYSTNFMKYGFTPGMGATCVVPEKLGYTLGHEMLYSAEYYRGKVLQQRGVQVTVVKKSEIDQTAMNIALSLNKKTRLSLVTLKEALTSRLRQTLPSVIEHELKMHEITFAQPEVKTMIEALYQ